MKNVKVSLGLALSFVLLLFSSQIYAQDSSRQGNIAYSNISFFAHGGEGVLDADFTGGTVRGSYAFSERFFFLADYSRQRTDDTITIGPVATKVTTQQGHLGLGFHTPVASNTDFVLTSQYAVAIVELPQQSVTTEGVLVNFGLRSRAIDRWELAVGGNYSSQLDQGEVGYSLSGHYYLKPQVSLGVNVESVFDVKVYGVILKHDL